MTNWSDCGSDAGIQATLTGPFLQLSSKAIAALNSLASSSNRGDGRWHTQEDLISGFMRVTGPHGHIYDIPQNLRSITPPIVNKLLSDLLNERIAVQKGRVG